MSATYLLALVVSVLGLGLLDWRHRIAVFDQRARALATVGIGVAFFLLLDLIGVGLGIFFRGEGPYLTGLLIAPEVPVEEAVFLTLLTYQTLLLWRVCERRAQRAVRATPGRSVTGGEQAARP